MCLKNRSASKGKLWSAVDDRFNVRDEGGWLASQCISQLEDNRDRGLVDAPLNEAHVVPLDTSLKRQLFLRELGVLSTRT